MLNASRIGAILFAIAIIAFGVEFIVFGNISALLPLAPGGSMRWFWITVLSLLLVVGGFSIALNKSAKWGALAVALVFILGIVFKHVPALLANVRNPGPWTTGGELLALTGGALMIAGGGVLARIGSFLFAACLIIVGVQHMLYADFISQIIPAWIPARLFFAYFVGVAFFAAAISIIAEIKTSLAGFLLAIMFLTWVVILHTPRVIGNIHTETEWTSLFVALAMGGIALVVARR